MPRKQRRTGSGVSFNLAGMLQALQQVNDTGKMSVTEAPPTEPIASTAYSPSLPSIPQRISVDYLGKSYDLGPRMIATGQDRSGKIAANQLMTEQALIPQRFLQQLAQTRGTNDLNLQADIDRQPLGIFSGAGVPILNRADIPRLGEQLQQPAFEKLLAGTGAATAESNLSKQTAEQNQEIGSLTHPFNLNAAGDTAALKAAEAEHQAKLWPDIKAGREAAAKGIVPLTETGNLAEIQKNIAAARNAGLIMASPGQIGLRPDASGQLKEEFGVGYRPEKQKQLDVGDKLIAKQLGIDVSSQSPETLYPSLRMANQTGNDSPVMAVQKEYQNGVISMNDGTFLVPTQDGKWIRVSQRPQ